MDGPVTIEIEARAGADREGIAWDPWRSVWVVHVREEPRRGRANDAILSALARWLGVPGAELRWVRAGKGARKVVAVDGLSAPEVRRRLEATARKP